MKNITTDEKMKALDILPLNKHLTYNKARLIHKIYYDKTPPYLKNLIKKAPDRYESSIILPPKPRIDLFKTSLAFSGAQIWNALPPDLRKIKSQTVFRNKLFQFLQNNH